MLSGDPSEIFRQEADELFVQLETALLDLERAPGDKETIASAFRALHTIKGSGAMFGFEALAKFTHHVETVFDRVRNGDVPVTPGLIGVTLIARDHMRLLIDAPHQVDAAAGPAILADLDRVVRGQGEELPRKPVAPPVRVVAPAPAPVPPPAAPGYRIRFVLPANAFVLGTNPASMIREMLEMGSGKVRCDASEVPGLDGLDPERCYLRWEIELITSHAVEAIEDVFLFIRHETQLTIEPLPPAPTPEEAMVAVESVGSERAESAESTKPVVAPVVAEPVARAPVSAPASSGKPAPEGVVKVNADRINGLMNQVGELVIVQSRLKQIAHSGEEELSILSLRAVVEEMGRLVSELRETTKGIRMVPIGSLFGRFRRVVRDLSKELGKQVRLETRGEETELDKTMVESLNDPLVHLIRNAMDHGIEHAEARRLAGKEEEGVLLLTATHVGGQVLIAVDDDGKGLNLDRIRAKAEERGLLAYGAEISDADLAQLIFHPGFSTAQSVTGLSGRGVGMDVVKKSIDALRGNVEVSSQPGAGCRVVLRLPLTLAIIDGLLLKVGEERYIVPLSNVDAIVELADAALEHPGEEGNRFLFIRDELVPFLHLRDLFAVPGSPPPHEKVVIVVVGKRRVGLVVDQILGDHQTVIKSLSRLHADVKSFSGATILGDGRVALILEIDHLIEFGQHREERLRDALDPARKRGSYETLVR
ncbi:MAG: chemotaxis protein CheA [Magnetococcales bacterium]|nr:chemotaxis protein CheA [Magnetococcales bacterium]